MGDSYDEMAALAQLYEDRFLNTVKKEYKNKMATIKGTCTKIHKNGRFYSVLVDEVWYGTGANRAECEEGNMIQFDAAQNGKYWNADLNTLEVLGKGAPKPAYKPKVTGGRTEAFAGKDDYWKKKEDRDVGNDRAREIGAGRNTAIAFVELLIKTDSIKLPPAQNKKADALFEAVEYYREKFHYAIGDKIVDNSKAEEEEKFEEDSYDE